MVYPFLFQYLLNIVKALPSDVQVVPSPRKEVAQKL